MSQYRLKIEKRVSRGIDKLPGNIRSRVWRAIYNLLDDPYPPQAEQMKRRSGGLSVLWRMHRDDWRIVYKPDDEIEIVEVVKVGQKAGGADVDFYDDLDDLN